MKYKYFSLILFLVLMFPIISASCVINSTKVTYTIGETITYTSSCSLSSEKTKPFIINLLNESFDEIQNITGITPTVKNTAFIDSYTIPSDYISLHGTNITARLYVDGVYKTNEIDNITTAGSSDLILNDFTITDDYFLGKQGAIKFQVKDSSGSAISNAQCIVDVTNGNNLPILSTGGVVVSQGNGYVLYSNFISEQTFTEGRDYKWDLSCTCHNTTGFTSNLPGYCFDESNGYQVDTFKHGEAQYPFTITDIADKLLIYKTVNITNWTGIWVENENGYRANMTASVSLLEQENIDWSIYAQEDGRAFLTAGEKFRVCLNANNTFDGAKHILMSDLLLIKYPGHLNYPLCMDNQLCGDNEIMHLEIQEGAYEKCSSWLKVPSYIKGQNKYKINFHMQVEGYEQEFVTASDRFTIFGERTDKDYIDYLNLNNVEFTKDNATEGEYVQFKLNVTNNHPFKNVPILATYQLFSNWNFPAHMRFLDTMPYNLMNYISPIDTFFIQSGIFPKNETGVSYSPRFKIPYGLINQDDYDIIAGTVTISFNGNDIKWETNLNPTIDIIDYDLEITNLTTTVSNTQTTSCDTITITTTYNNSVSDTNAKDEEDELFVIKVWFEDTTNDLYIDDLDIIFQPDQAIGDTFNFTTTIPYIGASGIIESEIDIKIYTYDESNTDPDCTNCGELVFEFSGDEGDGTFNITANPLESCKYLKQSITWEDDRLYNDYLERKALEGIENKTGTFRLDVNCPPQGIINDPMVCTISAQLEDPQLVQEETKFTCYIISDEIKYSETSFMKMITKEVSIIEKDFLIPDFFDDDTQHVLQCHADYFSGLGSRRDSFFDTFTAIESPPTDATGTGGASVDLDISPLEKVIDKTADIIKDIFKTEEKTARIISKIIIWGVLIGVIFLIVIIIIIIFTNKKKKVDRGF